MCSLDARCKLTHTEVATACAANAVYKAAKNVDESSCGYPQIIGADGTSLKASAAVSSDKQGIVLSVASAPAGFKPVAVRRSCTLSPPHADTSTRPCLT